MTVVITLSTGTRTCATCEFREGARQLDADGTRLFVDHSNGLCTQPDRVRKPSGFLDNLTEAGADDNGCPCWRRIRIMSSK